MLPQATLGPGIVVGAARLEDDTCESVTVGEAVLVGDAELSPRPRIRPRFRFSPKVWVWTAKGRAWRLRLYTLRRPEEQGRSTYLSIVAPALF